MHGRRSQTGHSQLLFPSGPSVQRYAKMHKMLCWSENSSTLRLDSTLVNACCAITGFQRPECQVWEEKTKIKLRAAPLEQGTEKGRQAGNSFFKSLFLFFFRGHSPSSSCVIIKLMWQMWVLFFPLIASVTHP